MEKWEAAVAEIRNLQAFSRFLLPPSYVDLQAVARHPYCQSILMQHHHRPDVRRAPSCSLAIYRSRRSGGS
ncbi:hypothetical protein BDR05DRAFT_971222, partial [Suillus weaverae]